MFLQINYQRVALISIRRWILPVVIHWPQQWNPYPSVEYRNQQIVYNALLICAFLHDFMVVCNLTILQVKWNEWCFAPITRVYINYVQSKRVQTFCGNRWFTFASLNVCPFNLRDYINFLITSKRDTSNRGSGRPLTISPIIVKHNSQIK